MDQNKEDKTIFKAISQLPQNWNDFQNNWDDNQNNDQ